jgi:hypothetical protein
MGNKSNSSLAALAFFQVTYNNSYDILCVLKEFIKYIISSGKLYNFTLTEIQSNLATQFNFNIPQFAIKSSLNKLVSSKEIGVKSKNTYEVLMINNLITNNALTSVYEENYKYLSETIEPLLKHYLQEKLYAGDVDEAINFFYEFIVNGKVEKNNELFHAFVLSNQSNQTFSQSIQAIQEGLVIHKALSYEGINEIGSFKDKLKLFLDTEIIFSWLGYNGSEYQKTIEELMDIISDVNRLHNNAIVLYYFENTKNELEQFFDAAIEIIKSGKIVDKTKTAMVTIINGCKEASCVIQKKVDFFKLLNKKIKLDSNDNYYKKENNEHNISYDDYNKVEDFKILDRLNNIHKLRRSKNVKYGIFHSIFLTADSRTIQISRELYEKNISDKSYLFLAINSFDLGGILWLKLKKPFVSPSTVGNKNTYPIDYFVKSRVALANMAKSKILEEYNSVIKNKDQYTEEQIADYINSLRDIDLRPEKITYEKIDEIIEIISEDRLIERSNHINKLENNLKKESEEKNNLLNVVKESENKIAQISSHNKSLVDTIIPDLKYKLRNKIRKYVIAKKMAKILLFPMLLVILLLIIFPYKYKTYVNVNDYLEYYLSFSTLIALPIFCLAFLGIAITPWRNKLSNYLLCIILKIFNVNKPDILNIMKKIKTLQSSDVKNL